MITREELRSQIEDGTFDSSYIGIDIKEIQLKLDDDNLEALYKYQIIKEISRLVDDILEESSNENIINDFKDVYSVLNDEMDGDIVLSSLHKDMLKTFENI